MLLNLNEKEKFIRIIFQKVQKSFSLSTMNVSQLVGLARYITLAIELLMKGFDPCDSATSDYIAYAERLNWYLRLINNELKERGLTVDEIENATTKCLRGLCL